MRDVPEWSKGVDSKSIIVRGSNPFVSKSLFERVLLSNSFIVRSFSETGGISGFYDLGPLGTRVFNNITKILSQEFEDRGYEQVITTDLVPGVALSRSGHLKHFHEKDRPLLYNLEFPASFYLRPETTIGFMANYPSFVGRFGFNSFYQIGNMYRNEIAPRNNLLRLRQFRAFEAFRILDSNYQRGFYNIEDETIPIILKGEEEPRDIKLIDLVNNHDIGEWTLFDVYHVFQCFKNMGLNKLFIEVKEDLSHYSLETLDIVYPLDGKNIEIAGISDRGNHDFKLTKDKEEYKGKKLVETSIGLDRVLYCLLHNNFYVDEDERAFFTLSSIMSPYRVAIFVLRNDEDLEKYRDELFNFINIPRNKIFSDTKNWTIGKKYRIADVIGIPFTITIDFETLENDTVTIRNSVDKRQVRTEIDRITRADSLEELYNILSSEVNE